MKLSRALAYFVFLLLIVFPVTALSQSTTMLTGTVTDPSGAVVPGAHVRLLRNATEAVRSTTTGANGSYEFNQILPGDYSLTITARGFQRYDVPAIHLLVNNPATVNAVLRVGAQTQVVSVTSAATPLNTTDARLGTPFTTQQIIQLPIESRNVGELLSLQTGVTYLGDRSDIDLTDDSRAGAVNGVRSDQSNFTLDGIDVNDQNNGYAFTSVLRQTPDSLQEFNIVTTNFLANQGRSARTSSTAACMNTFATPRPAPTIISLSSTNSKAGSPTCPRSSITISSAAPSADPLSKTACSSSRIWISTSKLRKIASSRPCLRPCSGRASCSIPQPAAECSR